MIVLQEKVRGLRLWGEEDRCRFRKFSAKILSSVNMDSTCRTTLIWPTKVKEPISNSLENAASTKKGSETNTSTASKYQIRSIPTAMPNFASNLRQTA